MRTSIAVKTLLLVVLAATAIAQIEPEKSVENAWLRRQQIQKQLAQDLRPAIDHFEATGNDELANRLRALLIPRDPQRQYVFFPPENQPEESRVKGLPDAMQQRLESVLAVHADRLFRFAGELAEQDLGCAAIQNLNEVLFFDPNHEAARRALGHRVIDDNGVNRWRVKSDRFRIKPASRNHRQFDWSPQQYLIASTANFHIDSRAGERQTEHLATQLERWNDVWEQVFFSYFDSAENIGRRIDGRAKARTRNRNYKVVLFADRDEYVRTLSRRVPGIAGSTGYYDYGMETSFFYASDDPTIEDTWRHELTHQLFQESRRSIAIPFEDQHLWLGEGIAMYFESMVDHGDYAVVGGFDARRLQYARLRRLKEQFRIPLQELAAASRTEFQGLPQLAKVYSLSAGVTHYLMDARYGASREPLIEFLKLCYQGKSNRKSFEDALGESFQQIETEYDKFLRVSAETIDMLDAPERKTELCLIGAELADDSLSAVGRCNNLTWLDLSACDVRGTRLAALESCPKLQQLFLTGAQLDPRAVHVLAQLRIAGLDLSGTDLTDDGLQSLAANAAGLQVLNVAGTKITREGWKSFVQNRPEIQIQSDFGQE